MKLRALLAGTAIASLALLGSAAVPGEMSFTSRAEAAVSVSFSVFYDELAAHGSWVLYDDAYVFIPADVDDDWRPYTRGHWVYADRYGWTWVSEEPFGWATYHYGRWGYAEDIGWYWVPGKRWAPAWVSWRRSADYVVWAPLPPAHGGDVDVSVSISVGDIPDFYWVAVPTRRFLEPDIRVVIINDDREIRQVVDRTEYVGAPRITNNIVVNNVIDVTVIEQETGQKVEPVAVRETSDPREARASENQVTVFEGELKADKQAKPPKVSEVKEVKKVKRGGKAEDAAGTAAPVPAPDTTTGKATEAPADGTAPAAESAGQAQPPAAGSESETTAEQPAKAKKKPATASEQPEDQVEQPAAEQAQPAKKDKQPEKKKAEDKAAVPEDATGSTAAPSEVEQGSKKDKAKAKAKAQGKADKEQQDCDPATNADCAPAE